MLPWNVVVVDNLLCARVCLCLLPLVTWSANHHHHHQRAHEYPTLVAKQRKFNATETYRCLIYVLLTQVSSSSCEYVIYYDEYHFCLPSVKIAIFFIIKYYFLLKSKHLSTANVGFQSRSNFTLLLGNNPSVNSNVTVLILHSNITVSILNRSSTSTEMADVREQLLSIEEKYKRFKQQQFIFITALERSREHARDKTEPVSTIAQVMMRSYFPSNYTLQCMMKQYYYK